MSDKKRVPRVERDGQVAILVSPGFGAGWSSWVSDPRAVFCPEIVEAIEAKKTPEEVEAIAKRIFPDAYVGGIGQVEIRWLSVGSSFRIHEYDGSESIEERDSMDWVTA